jgi:hypothetical protein
MGKQIHLSIADPCHESWDNMTTAEQGRFCASCQKQVVDFTNMTDTQLADFFKTKSTGSTCGRFYGDQLGRNIQVPRKTIPWIKYFFQIALPAFLMSAKASAQGKAGVKNTETTVTNPSRLMLGKVAAPRTMDVPEQKIIKGRVVDENNTPLPYAMIFMKGQETPVHADSSGMFTIEKPLTDKDIVLEVAYIGYQRREVTINRQTYPANGLVVQLSVRYMTGITAIATHYTKKPRKTKKNKGKKVETCDISQPVIKTPAETPAMIKIYPNPVLSGSAINISCEKLSEGYYTFQLVNQSGQQIESKQVWVDAEARIMNMEIPSVVAGSYVLTLINKETGKRFSEKIIVQ